MKCPACGYNTNTEYNYNAEIKNIMKTFSKSTQKIIAKTYREIMTNIQTELSKQKLFNFLLKIKGKENRAVRIACEGYLEKNYHMQGKGFNYLAAIIVGSDKNKKRLAQNEKKAYGSAPPKSELK